ncbi:MAG: TauD/TfdA family dioxygenase [Actinomycetota bacterium]
MSATADHVADIAFEASDLAAGAELFHKALLEHDVVRVRPQGDLGDYREYYDRMVETIGDPVEIAEDYASGGAPTGERWSPIIYDTAVPDNVAFRHSKNAQPLHTDESYVSSEIGVMFFYCERAAPSGGETVFVPGPLLIEYLGANEPELLERLTTMPVTYGKATDTKTRPIIEVAADGKPNFNYNYYCVAPDQDPAAVQLNADFFEFCQERLPSELIHPVDLKPGEGVAWKDYFVLHGRNSFEAHVTGDRTIWKTGIRWPT